MELEFIFQIAVLIMSVVVHEISHGYAAEMLGDPTARFAGRLTLNPIKHLDMMGSIVVPVISYMFGGFIFGWAKPVPFNPYNLRPGRFSEAIVAAAGPASNLCIALVFGVLLRMGLLNGFSENFLHMTALIVFINLLLMVFNLMPLPPLDGSKLLFAFFPERMYKMREMFERYGFALVIFFIFFLWQVVSPVVGFLFKIVTGVPIA